MSRCVIWAYGNLFHFCTIHFDYRCCHIATAPMTTLPTSHLLPTSPSFTSTIQTAQMMCWTHHLGLRYIFLCYLFHYRCCHIATTPMMMLLTSHSLPMLSSSTSTIQMAQTMCWTHHFIYFIMVIRCNIVYA